MVAGRTLLERAVELVLSAGLEPVVVAKATAVLPATRARLLTEPTEPHHPLAGIAFALRRLEAPIVVCPCDMPLLPPALLAALARRPGDELAIVSGPEGIEPLVGRFPPARGSELFAAAEAGEPARAVVERLGASILALDRLVPAKSVGEPGATPGDSEAALLSVNTPEQLDRGGATAQRSMSAIRGR